LLATIIIVFGSVAYYYASNLTTTATNNYSSSLADSQQAIAERIGFENVGYDSSSSKLTVYIINCGSANNIQINSVFLYNSSYNLVGVYSANSTDSISALKPINSGVPIPTISSLNVGKECYFTLWKDVSGKGISLSSGSIYTIHLITKSGGVFDYDFMP
jgi:hypothetical protein